MVASVWDDPALVQRLHDLWIDGHSTAKIGRILGVSKNAVISKARREGLQGRPSPIVPKGEKKADRVQPLPVSICTLPPMASEAVAPLIDLALIILTPPQKPIEPVVMLQAHQPIPLAKPARAGQTPPCCWPIGHPRTKGFRFCDAPSVPGRPYCMPHCRKAYVLVRSRDDETETATESVS